MTLNQLIEKAGMARVCKGNSLVVSLSVAQEAVKAEREACARVCDEMIPAGDPLYLVFKSFADNIRNRGEK